VSIKRPEYARAVRASGVHRALQHSQASKWESRQRTRPGVLFWLLIFVSSLPGAALVLDWEKWQMLPPGVRGSAYLLSLILVTGAFNLLLSPDGNYSPVSRQDRLSSEPRSIARGPGTIYLPSLHREDSWGSSRAWLGLPYAGSAGGSRYQSAVSADEFATSESGG